MTFITLISLILITVAVTVYLIVGRQNAVDSLLSISTFFVSLSLISYYIEIKYGVSFEGSLITVFGIMTFIICIVLIFVRQKAYRVRGNSNIEG
jgi:hypothetical protein